MGLMLQGCGYLAWLESEHDLPLVSPQAILSLRLAAISLSYRVRILPPERNLGKAKSRTSASRSSEWGPRSGKSRRDREIYPSRILHVVASLPHRSVSQRGTDRPSRHRWCAPRSISGRSEPETRATSHGVSPRILSAARTFKVPATATAVRRFPRRESRRGRPSGR